MHTRHALALLALAPTLALAQSAEQHLEPASSEQLAADAVVYTQHINTLANPFFEGRAPGTRGNRLAADYIEFTLRRANLKPAFGETGFRQPFTAPGSRAPHGKVLLIHQQLSYGDTKLVPGKDFTVLGYSSDGELTNAPLAFAGYSISDGKDGYDTYADEPDLAGKVVIVFRFEPVNDQGRSRWAAATEDEDDNARRTRWTGSAQVDAKLRNAADAGAAAIILVNPPGADDPRVGTLEGLNYGRPMRIPVLMMSIDAADSLVRASAGRDISLLELRKRADEKAEVVDFSKGSVSLAVVQDKPSLATDNVGAVITGNGHLADQWIIVGSHYDHVGYGPVGARPENFGKIHPGADDNASGSSGNLLIAQRLAETLGPDAAPRRSILFLWFSAEESGLEGAQYFVRHPTMPLANVSLMLNMDMIGRLRPGKFEVGGVGTGLGLEEWTAPYWATFGVDVKPVRIGASNSDHFAFHLKKVPNIFVFTGLHKEYHTPADTIETVNIDGAVQVADLIARLTRDAAHRDDPFKFSTGQVGADDAEEDPHAAAPANTGSVSGLPVRFGIMPGDYSGDDGVLIGDVTAADLPAAKAGLKADDLMLTWNGQALKGVEQWMGLLMKSKPGDKVTITYRRETDGKPETLTTTATLAPASKPRQ